MAENGEEWEEWVSKVQAYSFDPTTNPRPLSGPPFKPSNGLVLSPFHIALLAFIFDPLHFPHLTLYFRTLVEPQTQQQQAPPNVHSLNNRLEYTSSSSSSSPLLPILVISPDATALSTDPLKTLLLQSMW